MPTELNADIELEINEKYDAMYELHQDNTPKFLLIEKLFEEIWQLIPEPKEKWAESYRTLSEWFVFCLDNLRDFDKAAIQLNRLKKLEDKSYFSLGQYFFLQGRLYYEQENYVEAYKSFKQCVSEGKGFRYFKEENPKYFRFYSTPEKYNIDASAV